MANKHPRDKNGNVRDPHDTAYKVEKRSDGTLHHTWFDGQRNRRISYDTTPDGIYIPRTGHEVDQNTGDIVDRWD